jgi:hypothetical protein
MLKEASRRRRSKVEIDEAKANEISQNQRLNQIETQNIMLQQQLLELQANSNRDTQVIQSMISQNVGNYNEEGVFRVNESQDLLSMSFNQP